MSKTETPDIVALLRERGAWHDEGKVWEQDALCVAAAAKIERLRAELAKHQWRTMESAPLTGLRVTSETLLLAHASKKWIRFGKWYVQERCWYYSGTNERSQWAQVKGDAPTHWQPLPSPQGENDG